MISFEEVRQVGIAAYNDVHVVSFPTIPVNYPDRIVVDLEHQVDPFVSVELEFNPASQTALGERELFVSGFLRLYHYTKDGTGTSASLVYVDDVNEELALKNINNVWFGAPDILDVVSFPGWKGKLVGLEFKVSDGVSCST